MFEPELMKGFCKTHSAYNNRSQQGMEVNGVCGSEVMWMELFNSKRDLAATIFKMPVYIEDWRKGDGHSM